MNGQFNAIDYAQQLEAAGVPQAQAEVHAKMLALALVSCSASRADLAALGDKLNCRSDAIHQESDNRIDALQQDVSNRIDALRQDVSNRIDALERDVSNRFDALERDVSNRFDALERDVSNRIEALRQELSGRIDALAQELRSTRKLFFWMFGTNTALSIAVLVKQFFP